MSELDGEEKEILDAFDEGELRRSDNFHERVAKHKQYAEGALRTDESILRRYVEGGLRKESAS